MRQKADKQMTKKQMVAWAIVCAFSILLFLIPLSFLSTVMFYSIPVFISVMICMTAVMFVRYKGLTGEEVLKPVCVVLFCMWFILQRTFVPLIDSLPKVSWEDYSMWWACIFGMAIAALAILYLVRARKKKARKYPMVICFAAALFLIFVWGLMV